MKYKKLQSGDTIWFLTALYPTEQKYDRETLWMWKCVCGKEKTLRPSQIRVGHIKSCGCMRHQLVENRKKLPSGEAAFRQLLRAYKKHAKDRNFPFELSSDHFRELTKQDCYYCGERPKQKFQIKANKTDDYIYNGIDRLNSKKGYVKGNVVSCCGTCNRMKMDSMFSDFLSKVASIYKTHTTTLSLLESEI